VTPDYKQAEAEALPVRHLYPERGEIHPLDKPISFDRLCSRWPLMKLGNGFPPFLKGGPGGISEADALANVAKSPSLPL